MHTYMIDKQDMQMAVISDLVAFTNDDKNIKLINKRLN